MSDLEFNDDGTVTVRPDPSIPDSVTLRRPRLGEYRVLCELMDQANRAVQAWMAQPPADDVVSDAVELAVSETIGQRQSAALTRKINERAGAYALILHQRVFLESNDNPFPAVWAEVLRTLAGWDGEVSDVQAWMAEPEALSALKNHWTTVPLSRGPSAAAGAPNGLTPTATPNALA